MRCDLDNNFARLGFKYVFCNFFTWNVVALELNVCMLYFTNFDVPNMYFILLSPHILYERVYLSLCKVADTPFHIFHIQ